MKNQVAFIKQLIPVKSRLCIHKRLIIKADLINLIYTTLISRAFGFAYYSFGELTVNSVILMPPLF